ncbi:hypothetical protein [Vibrio parahaemolyticus]|uniref:hypothetical protein n=1 Tax=Vibrio parahaemolyticus TaxID=670 RepID=UPI00112380C0|nr:hypothetical protein [Vibrio parahaemolyticus]MBE3844223.1 hypothetical protein [Vibrio parahaemolyticus]MBE3945141.1 hypothetical protein [Vibrio parahaemolyticus]MBE4119970.1 hypothetical protein [Vibrio parahaemolyticus]MBE4439547.1 hypothetical protein [Vibrio parahaemolyticus]MEA5289658.1 hypothetical protein [Vibrio parahaemolyticus]
MFIKSIADHALKPLETPNSIKRRLINIDDIEIINWRGATLEEMEQALPDNLKRTPASTLVREALKQKIKKNPTLELIEQKVIQCLSENADIQARDKENSPLNKYEEKFFMVLLERIIGGCSSPKSLLPAIKKVKQFCKSLYEDKQFASLRVGAIISTLKDHFHYKLEMARLSHNTLRKIITEYAPISAFRKGREHGNLKAKLIAYIKDNYEVTPT